MNPIELAQITLAVLGGVAGIVSPFILFYLAGAQRTRRSAFANIDERLSHLDLCFDGLRLKVVEGFGAMLGREEFETKLGYERSERHRLASDLQSAILSLADRQELKNLDDRLMAEIRELRRGGK